jgi:hypothetical protein
MVFAFQKRVKPLLLPRESIIEKTQQTAAAKRANINQYTRRLKLKLDLDVSPLEQKSSV